MTTANRVRARRDRAALNRPLPTWLRGRHTQRALTVLWVTAWTAVIAARLVTDPIIAEALLLVLALVVQVLLLRIGRLTSNLYGAGLDERQRAIVDRMYRQAYPVAMIVLFAVWILIAPFGVGVSSEALADVLMPVFFLLGGLPAAILVWTDPEPAEV